VKAATARHHLYILALLIS